VIHVQPLENSSTLGHSLTDIDRFFQYHYSNSLAMTSCLRLQVFDHAEAVGLEPSLVDIGGGFPGNGTDEEIARFRDFAAAVNDTIARLFPGDKYRFISEPGARDGALLCSLSFFLDRIPNVVIVLR
jgi:pyridoxal-dependent decarboxylase-like protein